MFNKSVRLTLTSIMGRLSSNAVVGEPAFVSAKCFTNREISFLDTYIPPPIRRHREGTELRNLWNYLSDDAMEKIGKRSRN